MKKHINGQDIEMTAEEISLKEKNYSRRKFKTRRYIMLN